METKKLEMIFLNDLGKNFTLSVDEPRYDLEKTEIEKAMEDIIGIDVFEQNLVSVGKARFITKTVEDII